MTLKDDELEPRREEEQCPSVNLHGIRCRGQRDHAALHNAEVDGVLYVWSDQASPALAIDLLRPKE
jgi:hypothetical protein